MMSEKLSSACGLALGLAIFSLVAVGCGGSSGGSGGGQVAPATHTALVVGDASGAAYDAITSKYKIVHGSGSENPAKFDLILFDGNSTDAQQLHDNPGTSAFLYAGKMLVIVNPFLSHRDKGLKGILWVRPLGSSSGSNCIRKL